MYEEFTIIKKLYIYFNVASFHSFQNQLNEGGLMKNDELTTDLVSSAKLTAFQKLTRLCDYHKLILNNQALTLFKCHMRYRTLHRTTKNIWGFSVFSRNQFFL